MDDARVPVGSLGPLAQGRGEPQVESAVVDADDDVRPFGDALVEQLVEEAAEGPVAADDLPEADDRVRGEIDGELDPGGSHGGATSAGEAQVRSASTPRMDQLGSELVTAGFTRDQEGMHLRHGRTMTEGRSGRNCGVRGDLGPGPREFAQACSGSWIRGYLDT